MKFLKAKFHHWTGIRLGLGVDDLELDFTKSKNRICLVLGTNGSGKTTILEGLTLFTDIYSAQRDSNDFIDVDESGNKDGYRHIYFQNGNDVFLSKVEWIGDKTRCYLTRVDSSNWDRELEDLNPSGNVRSYEEQLFLRFGLTKEYNKLLFLGPGLSDIITMTPSERKNNISKFTPNIDKYLELYKQTGKYYSKLKSDLAVVTSEIHRLGDDRNKVEALRDSSKEKYNVTLEKLQQFKNVESTVLKTISLLSVNGVSVKDIYELKVSQINNLVTDLNRSNITFKNLCLKYGLSTSLSDKEYEDIALSTRDELTGLKFQESNFQNRNQELSNSKQNVLNTLESRKSMYNQFVKDNNPEKFINEQRALNAELLEIQETIEQITLDNPSLKNKDNVLFSKDDTTKYLVFIDNLMTKIDSLESIYEEQGIFSKYSRGEFKNESSESRYSQLKERNLEIERRINELRNTIAGYEGIKDIADLLTQIPSDCKNPNCPFIQKAKMFTVVSENKGKFVEELSTLNSELESNNKEISKIETYVERSLSFTKDIQSLMTFINGYTELIAKFPDRELVMNPRTIIQNTAFLLPRARAYSEYSFIMERYNDILKRLLEIKDTIEKTSEYQKLLKSQEIEIENLEKSVQNLSQQIQQLYNENQIISQKVSECQIKLSDLSTIVNTRKCIVSGLKAYDSGRKEVKKLKKHYIASRYFTDRLSELRKKMQYMNDDLRQYELELNTAEYNLRRYDEFVIQRDQLTKEYELLDILRKCWSPTTGIPLIFIEDFMNRLLKDANKYLKEIWNDEDFLISGFDIDEKNFFILVDRGDGFTKKDASQCSGAERAMLCTVLSLALLKQLPNIESIYNIPKFDEIDGTLDFNKKQVFLGILTDLLDDICSEQAFIISHSGTFQSDVDVLLLNGSREYEERFLNGNYNVIYRY